MRGPEVSGSLYFRRPGEETGTRYRRSKRLPARRYTNEYPPYVQDTGHRMMEPFDPVTQRYLRIPSWLIVDAAGCARAPLGFPTYNDPARRLRWSDDNAAEIATGILERADTVAEMAAAMNAEEGVLADTLAR